MLDVTTGDGAFMKKIEDAKRLAQTMVRIGKLANRRDNGSDLRYVTAVEAKPLEIVWK